MVDPNRQSSATPPPPQATNRQAQRTASMILPRPRTNIPSKKTLTLQNTSIITPTTQTSILPQSHVNNATKSALSTNPAIITHLSTTAAFSNSQTTTHSDSALPKSAVEKSMDSKIKNVDVQHFNQIKAYNQNVLNICHLHPTFVNHRQALHHCRKPFDLYRLLHSLSPY